MCRDLDLRLSDRPPLPGDQVPGAASHRLPPGPAGPATRRHKNLRRSHPHLYTSMCGLPTVYASSAPQALAISSIADAIRRCQAQGDTAQSMPSTPWRALGMHIPRTAQA